MTNRDKIGQTAIKSAELIVDELFQKKNLNEAVELLNKVENQGFRDSTLYKFSVHFVKAKKYQEACKIFEAIVNAKLLEHAIHGLLDTVQSEVERTHSTLLSHFEDS
jgi:hypothetical protein